MQYPVVASSIFLFLSLLGCAVDPDAADQRVSPQRSVVTPTCATGTWCTETSPVTSLLHGVWAVSASDVFAVGDGGTILRRTGGAWSAMASGSSSSLRGVWALSSSNVWAVGTTVSASSSTGTILRFNGTSWSTVTPGITLPSSLDAVWGSSANDVWLVGSGTVLHWNGSTFSTSATFSGTLGAVSGTGPTDVWATGENTNLHHFTGGIWTNPTIPGLGTSTFFAVLALATNNVWVTDFVSNKETEQWTGGSSWTPHATNSGAGAGIFNGLSALAANDIWGAGASRIGHWDGSAWTTSSPLGSVSLWSVTTVAGHAWVVGSGGTIAHRPL